MSTRAQENKRLINGAPQALRSVARPFPHQAIQATHRDAAFSPFLQTQKLLLDPVVNAQYTALKVSIWSL